jgi:hypothetical protein
MAPTIWFITYDGLPCLDPDDALVAEDLRKRGFTCEAKIWNDKSVDWSKCELGVVRSTWNYHQHYDEFERWMLRPELQGKLWNPPAILRWNSKKTYLRELENSGVRIVPTIWIDRTTPAAAIDELLERTSWEKAVLKPTILELLKSHDAMLQPYMQEIETSGERSLMFVGGKFTHAIRKAPFQKLAVAGHAGEQSIEPESDEIALAHQVLNTVGQELLYARVDVVRDADHKPCLMELELVEPSLFMGFHKPCIKAFADAIEQVAVGAHKSSSKA